MAIKKELEGKINKQSLSYDNIHILESFDLLFFTSNN